MDDIYISKRPSGSESGEPIQVDLQLPPQPPQYPPPEDQIPEPEKRPKKKKKHRLKKAVKAIIIIILAFSVVFTVLAGISGYSRESLKRNEYVKSSDLLNSPLITNYLLIGTDAEDGASRSDSMMIMSVDLRHGGIKLTSLLRDSWVEIPAKGRNGKLNSAYSSGGAQMLCDTIEYNFGVDIDHYVKVDFEMFVALIDKLGGIDVEVTEKEANFINKTTRQKITWGESVHLNGEEALVYTRIRKLDTDYMRTYRQRKVIIAILDKIKSPSVFRLLSNLTGIMSLIETDLTAPQITSAAFKCGLALISSRDIEQIRIPSDNYMRTGYAGSQWVEYPDLDMCRKELEEFIYTGAGAQDDD